MVLLKEKKTVSQIRTGLVSITCFGARLVNYRLGYCVIYHFFLLPYSILLSTNCAISSIICTELGNVSKSSLITSVTTVHGLDIQK